MTSISRSAGLICITLVVAAALVVAGCGGDGVPADMGTITGTVIHADTGAGLGDIRVSAGGVETRTAHRPGDRVGTFRLERVPEGSYTLNTTLKVEADPERNLHAVPSPDPVTVVPGETIEIRILMVHELPPDPN